MSQPPWEGLREQPAGWGPPGPQQPGGWNQDPQPTPAYDQYAYGQQYPQPAYPPQPYPPYQPPAFPPPPKKHNGGLIAGVLGSIGILIAAGVSVAVLNSRDHDRDPGTPAVAAPVGTPSPGSSMSFPNNAYPSDGSDGSGSASAPDSDSSTADDGSSALDRAATDTTPFTTAAMVASTFTDAKNVGYTLKSAGTQPCSKAGDKTVVAIVTSAPCTEFMSASWLDKSGRVLVSAMIFPYPDAATATKVENELGDAAHTEDYSQWCPPAGQADAALCAKLVNDDSASREGKFGSYHRYLLVTTAVYTDLRDDDSQKAWLSAAADGAFQNTLPDT